MQFTWRSRWFKNCFLPNDLLLCVACYSFVKILTGFYNSRLLPLTRMHSLDCVCEVQLEGCNYGKCAIGKLDFPVNTFFLIFFASTTKCVPAVIFITLIWHKTLCIPWCRGISRFFLLDVDWWLQAIRILCSEIKKTIWSD